MTTASASAALEHRLAELLMSALAPCDLGDGIEVVHDVEAVEIEMDCAVDEDDEADEPAAADTLPELPVFDEPPLAATTQFSRVEEVGTHQFVRESAPYDRIELQLDPGAFRRATIEEAMQEVHRGRT